MSTLGMTVIYQSLRDASSIVASSSREAVQAMAFIRGSSLELTIERFSLDLDAGTLRNEFFQILKIKA